MLVADDDRAIRESLATAVELEGYDVVSVVDGVETLTRVRRDAFNALVVDADDYLAKPVRAQRTTRSTAGAAASGVLACSDGASTTLRVASLLVDPAARRVRRGGGGTAAVEDRVDARPAMSIPSPGGGDRMRTISR